MAYSSVWLVASSVRHAASSNGRMPEGFHRHRPQFSLGFHRAQAPHSCSTSKRFQGREKACTVPSSSLRRGRESVVVRAAGGGALMDGRALKHVVVTGANRGLGFAIADRMLAIGGYRVVLACRDQQEVCRRQYSRVSLGFEAWMAITRKCNYCTCCAVAVGIQIPHRGRRSLWNSIINKVFPRQGSLLDFLFLCPARRLQATLAFVSRHRPALCRQQRFPTAAIIWRSKMMSNTIAQRSSNEKRM